MTKQHLGEEEDCFNQAVEANLPGTGRTTLQLLPQRFRTMTSPPSTPRPRRRQKTLSSKGRAGADVFGCPLTPQAALLQQPGTTEPDSPLGIQSHDGVHLIQLSPRSACNFTPEQQAQVDAMREEVRELEAAFREATEKDLPTDALNEATDAKRQELQALLMKFRTENAPFGLLHSRRMSDASSSNVSMQAPMF